MSWEMDGAQRLAEELMPDRFAAEERVARYVADKMGLDLVSFPRYSVVDRLLVMRGLASAYIEVKTRTTPRTAYPTYRISFDKWLDLRALANSTKVPTLLIVEWGCGAIGSSNVLDPKWKIAGGSAYLPIGRFRPLRKAEV